MCGPIVVSLSLNLKGKRILPPHLLYNIGRIITYILLGGVMGATGSFVRMTAPMAGIQKGVMIFTGLLIIIMGCFMSGWVPLGKFFGDYYNPNGFIATGFKRLLGIHSTLVYFPLGLLLGLLPCGPVYTALIAAARAGMEANSSLEGIFMGTGLMACFGIGTVPALLMVAKFADLGWLKNREKIYKFSAVMMIIVGIYFVVKGIQY